MIDLFREIWQTVSNNKLRTFLTGIAVAWGIFMLVVLTGMSNGVVNAFNENRMAQGSNTLRIYGGTTTDAWHGYKEGRKIQLKIDDIERLEQQNATHTGAVTATIEGQIMTMSTPHDYISASYAGVFPAWAQNEALTLKHGRFINGRDITERRKVMVLPVQSAESLFGTADKAVGQHVSMGNLSFNVVGVYDANWARNVYIPFSTARVLNGGGNDLASITVVLRDVSTMDDGENAEAAVRQTLSSAHDFNPADDSAVDIWNRFTQQLQMSEGMNILQVAVWVIGLFTLLSGIIGVSNIMFVSVRERTHEIGIRRAIGAKPRSILAQIILESVVITTLSGYIGVFLGSAVNEVIARLSEGTEFISNPRTDLSLALSVTAVLIIAGIFAGLFPALKALKVKPVEALRDE